MDIKNTVNAEFVKQIAKELREVYDRPRNAEDDPWLEVAEKAVARLMPIAVNSELPNDARMSSGAKPRSEAIHESIGNPTEHGKNLKK